MTHQLFVGKVMHARLKPQRHEFSYATYLHCLDLDQLDDLNRRGRLCGHNRFGLYSLYDCDFLEFGTSSLRSKVEAQLKRHGITQRPVRIQILTSLRFLGYAFNPATFYFCEDETGAIIAHVLEINNTFSEKHVYVFKGLHGTISREQLRYSQKKEFHVSPFFSRDYEYDLRFEKSADTLDIGINLCKDGKTVFVSRLWGSLIAHSKSHILSTLARQPLSAVLTMSRISYQAARLYFMKQATYHSKPNPDSTNTIRAEAYSWLDRCAIGLIRRNLSRIERGALTLEFPDGRREEFGDRSADERAHMKLHNFSPFMKILKSGQIGLGDSYCDADWSSDNLPALLSLFLNNYHRMAEEKVNVLKPFRWAEALWHKLRRNNRGGSRKNIRAHYDLSNEFFKLWLDPSMTYSAAHFHSPHETLEQAQHNKIRDILQKARILPGQKLLEIGSGWGSLLLEAAQRHGADVTSLTLSKEQKKVADRRIIEANLADQARVLLSDYRSIQDKFDRIVSVEMLEAVGKEYLPTFFKQCNRLLKDDGILVLQVITYPDQYYQEYCGRSDWIQKRIFPGSHLPSIEELVRVATKHSNLMVESMENIGPHYARTLKLWREKFLAVLPEVRALGYDDKFIRTWEFYLASCEAEFGTRWLANMQIVFTRANNQYLMSSDCAQGKTPPLYVLAGGKHAAPEN